MLYRYLILFVGAGALLIGVQIPNFLTQYQQRLDAQLTEALVYYAQYQKIADTYYGGDIEKVIAAHENSEQPAFQAEVEPLRDLVARVKNFRYQQQLMQGDYVTQLWNLATQADPELRAATWREYSYNVPLSQRAVVTGLIVAFLLVVLMDLCVGGCQRAYQRMQQKRRRLEVERRQQEIQRR